MLKETKREVCNRMFVGNIWMIRNKVWDSLSGCGALIIWDSKKLTSEEVVPGFFGHPLFMVLKILFLRRIFGWNS